MALSQAMIELRKGLKQQRQVGRFDADAGIGDAYPHCARGRMAMYANPAVIGQFHRVAGEV
jgi:hypothetical protein